VSPPRGGLAALLESAADAVASATAELNRLDGFAGDGDLGITMSEAARALKEVLATIRRLSQRSCSPRAVRR